MVLQVNRLITTFTVALALTACNVGDQTKPLPYGEVLELVVDAFCTKVVECEIGPTYEECFDLNMTNICAQEDCSEFVSDTQMELLPFCLEAQEEMTCPEFGPPDLCFTVLNL